MAFHLFASLWYFHLQITFTISIMDPLEALLSIPRNVLFMIQSVRLIDGCASVVTALMTQRASGLALFTVCMIAVISFSTSSCNINSGNIRVRRPPTYIGDHRSDGIFFFFFLHLNIKRFKVCSWSKSEKWNSMYWNKRLKSIFNNVITHCVSSVYCFQFTHNMFKYSSTPNVKYLRDNFVKAQLYKP